MNKLIWTGCFLLNTLFISAQVFTPNDYPKGYFRNPLDIPISLSGNFGELRPNHYHMGLDFRTEKRENLRVYAAADGYIARIKIEPAGFGRAIYVNHPNGLTTVYCHLNDFTPALENWIKGQQYQQESWKLTLDPPANLFPVKKSDFLAFSGNTGGSQAPHLHFEIRRTADEVNLNPMLFGFPLADNTSPSLLRLALYNRNHSIYQQTPQWIAVKKSGTIYSTSAAVINTTASKISLAITAYDTHNGSSNLNGIFEAVLEMDDKAVIGFQMDKIGYEATRYMNAHIDYKTKSNGGPYLQHLSELPGYMHSIYKKVTGDGVLDISDGQVHRIRIVVKDAYGNKTTLETSVQYKSGGNNIASPTGKIFYPLMLDVYESSDCEFFMGERCLYDAVAIQHTRSIPSNAAVVSAVHTIGHTGIPLQDSMVVRIQPIRPLSRTQQEHTLMQRFAGTKKNVLKVQWQKEWATAKFRDFGSFQLVIDETPPEILPIGFNDKSNVAGAKKLLVTVKDNYESFKNFRATLDGKWLRFSNDKGKTFVYVMDEKFPVGEHELIITVEDEAGNKATKKMLLTR